jgi:hypothetical protein
MSPLRAVVRNGRLTLSEPTALPEGAVVFLEPVADAQETVAHVEAEHRELNSTLISELHEARVHDEISRRARERVETLPRQRALDEISSRLRPEDTD